MQVVANTVRSVVGRLVDKQIFWPSGISESKKHQLANHLYIKELFAKIKDRERVSLYVQANRAFVVRQQMADMYKKWCEDYTEGRTDEMPTINAIARHFKVTPTMAKIVLGPFDTKFFTYNYISLDELKAMGLYGREDIPKENQAELET